MFNVLSQRNQKIVVYVISQSFDYLFCCEIFQFVYKVHVNHVTIERGRQEVRNPRCTKQNIFSKLWTAMLAVQVKHINF